MTDGRMKNVFSKLNEKTPRRTSSTAKAADSRTCRPNNSRATSEGRQNRRRASLYVHYEDNQPPEGLGDVSHIFMIDPEKAQNTSKCRELQSGRSAALASRRTRRSSTKDRGDRRRRAEGSGQKGAEALETDGVHAAFTNSAEGVSAVVTPAEARRTAHQHENKYFGKFYEVMRQRGSVRPRA